MKDPYEPKESVGGGSQRSKRKTMEKIPESSYKLKSGTAMGKEPKEQDRPFKLHYKKRG